VAGALGHRVSKEGKPTAGATVSAVSAVGNRRAGRAQPAAAVAAGTGVSLGDFRQDRARRTPRHEGRGRNRGRQRSAGTGADLATEKGERRSRTKGGEKLAQAKALKEDAAQRSADL